MPFNANVSVPAGIQHSEGTSRRSAAAERLSSSHDRRIDEDTSRAVFQRAGGPRFATPVQVVPRGAAPALPNPQRVLAKQFGQRRF